MFRLEQESSLEETTENLSDEVLLGEVPAHQQLDVQMPKLKLPVPPPRLPPNFIRPGSGVSLEIISHQKPFIKSKIKKYDPFKNYILFFLPRLPCSHYSCGDLVGNDIANPKQRHKKTFFFETTHQQKFANSVRKPPGHK
jgi:hypothetical protein